MPAGARPINKMKHDQNRSRPKGVSLVEMLLVVAIVGILMGMGSLVLSGVISSVELSATAGEISTIFNRAREEAITRNKNVQIRIYQTSSELFQDEEGYRVLALGTVVPSDSPNANPNSFPIDRLEKDYHLPQSQVFLDSAPYSTMISGNDIPDKDILKGSELIDGVLTPFVAITFTPDNRADLSTTHHWTLTLVQQDSRGLNSSSLPDNFITFQLLPGTGKVNLNQPL